MFEVTQAHRRAIDDIIDQKEALKERSKEITEAIKALADEIQVKPAELNPVIALIAEERANPGALEAKREQIDLASDVA